jgi:hypothetical protein
MPDALGPPIILPPRRHRGYPACDRLRPLTLCRLRRRTSQRPNCAVVGSAGLAIAGTDHQRDSARAGAGGPKGVAEKGRARDTGVEAEDLERRRFLLAGQVRGSRVPRPCLPGKRTRASCARVHNRDPGRAPAAVATAAGSTAACTTAPGSPVNGSRGLRGGAQAAGRRVGALAPGYRARRRTGVVA